MRDRVWFWYPLKRGGYKVVKKVEHGRPGVPSYYRGPFPTKVDAERFCGCWTERVSRGLR